MPWLIDQILALLATEAGSLMYHLVLAFCIAGALQLAVTHEKRPFSAVTRRLIIGLVVLLVLQIVLFISSGFAWQGVFDGQSWLPLLDRSVTLISIVVLVWLWCFPNPNPGVDAATLIVGFLAIIGSVFGSLWWLRISTELGITDQPINGSAIDLNFQIASMLLLGLGLLLLLANRPIGWEYGFSMLLLLIMGHVFHLILLPYSGDYPYALRLFQMAAYPFLLLLPQRAVMATGPIPAENRQELGGEKQVQSEIQDLSPRTMVLQSNETQFIQSLLALTDEASESQTCRRVVSILAQASRADFAYLVSPPDASGNIHILCGYDKTTKRYVEMATVDGRSFPILVSCMKMGRVRRLPASSASPDRLSLGKLYGLEQSGAMLFIPVLTPDGKPLNAAILVAADPHTDWSLEDQSSVNLLAKFLVQFHHRAQEYSEMRSDLDKSRQAARRVQEQAQLIVEEERKLRDQLAVLQERAGQDREQLVHMSAVVAEHALFQSKLAQMREENELLREALEDAQQEAEKRSEPLIGELRMTLEEISLLRTAMTEAENRLSMMEFAPSRSDLSNPQLENIVSISEELRQPLSSIIGYTDLLLGESTGILGSNQRKFLERIKLSTKRFGRLLDELLQVSMAESDPTRIEHQEVDLRAVIHEALRETDGLFQLRRLVLRSRLPERPLIIQSDRDALRKILTQLLRNAATANPEGGEVGVTAWLESSDSEKDFILVQVSDKGGGIPSEDLPIVFNPHPETFKIEGLGDGGVDFVRLKTLIEVLGGRTWVDSEQGIGSVFSILLPAIHEPDQTNGSEGIY